MFNVGGMELLVIAVLALIVLGPDKLPGAIRQVGNVVGELRRISSGFQTDLRGALDEAEREASEKANAAAPSSDTPDPGAARAAAHAELEAAEAALAADHDLPSEVRSSAADAGSEGSPEASSSIDDDEDSTRAAS
jgi:sec-independent protein translocase protein TatB